MRCFWRPNSESISGFLLIKNLGIEISVVRNLGYEVWDLDKLLVLEGFSMNRFLILKIYERCEDILTVLKIWLDFKYFC